MLSDSFQRELQEFDVKRVLPAWDGLITKQQSTLEGQGVPGMFITTAGVDREVRFSFFFFRIHHNIVDVQRQQRMIKILEGIME